MISSAKVPRHSRTGPEQTMMAPPELMTPEMGPYKIPSRQYHRKNEDHIPYSPISGILHSEDPLEDHIEEDCIRYRERPRFEKRIYRSPRLSTYDSEIFPTDPTLYQDAGQRWQFLSKQAGPHQQNGSILTVQRNMTPLSLKCGMVTHVAGRVLSLNLWLDHREDILPRWLDVIAKLLPNLEHLALSQDIFEGEEEIEVSNRMRRLYVLYRLPDLKSIDDMSVTRVERKLARPSTPNGERVNSDTAWTGKHSSLLNCDEDIKGKAAILEDDDDIMPIPATESIGNQTADELGAELAQLAQRVAIICDEDDDHDEGEGDIDVADDDTLTGEDLAGLLAVSMSLSGEQHEDLSSVSVTADDREGQYDQNIQLAPAYSQDSRRSIKMSREDYIEAGLSHSLTDQSSTPLSSTRKGIPAPSRVFKIHERPDTNQKSDGKSSRRQRSLLSQPSVVDTMELVSVASSHHEWTAACGVLSFRTDRACAPRLRLNFCGRNSRKRIAHEAHVENTIFSSEKELLGTNNTKSGNPTITKNVVSMHGSETALMKPSSEPATNGNMSLSKCEDSTPVDTQSANEKLPPSKSLSSPFPMQFRERRTQLRISTTETNLKSHSDNSVIPSSPHARGSVPLDTITKPITLTVLAASPPRKKHTSGRGTKKSRTAKGTARNGLPPPPPGGVARRKVVAASLLQNPVLKSRKARKLEKRKKAARSTSMLDMDDDDDDEEEDELDENYQEIENASDKDAIHNGYEW